MHKYWLSHLSDGVLSRELAALVSRDRATTGELLAHIAEFDSRRLYAAGYASMHAYCVGELRLSEDAAYKRIRAARAARDFPVIYDMLADGRLHLAAVVLLKPWLSRDNVKDLLAAATRRTKAEIERLVAERFPQPDVPAFIRALPAPAGAPQLAPGPVGASAELAPGPVEDTARPGTQSTGCAPAPAAGPGSTFSVPAAPPAPRPRVAPLAPLRYAVQFTMDEAMHADLIRAQELLGRGATGEIPEVFRRALRALVESLEKRKCGATSKPKADSRPSNGRHIPAAVRRQVWERDQARCTFIAESRQRCGSRENLEFDHIEPVARGGKSTFENLRLRCRAHNQLEAERAFGGGFMHEIREPAKQRRHPRSETESQPAAPIVLRAIPPPSRPSPP